MLYVLIIQSYISKAITTLAQYCFGSIEQNFSITLSELKEQKLKGSDMKLKAFMHHSSWSSSVKDKSHFALKSQNDCQPLLMFLERNTHLLDQIIT